MLKRLLVPIFLHIKNIQHKGYKQQGIHVMTKVKHSSATWLKCKIIPVTSTAKKDSSKKVVLLYVCKHLPFLKHLKCCGG